MSSRLISSMPKLLEGLMLTIEISLAAILVGLFFGLLCGILSAKQMRLPLFGALLSAYVWTIRGTPLFVQLLIVYYVLPELLGFSLSPIVAGVVALGINSTAYISQIIRSGIDAVAEGQWEAAYVLGLGPWKTLKGVVLPQTLRMTLPALTGELSSLVKETSILMAIGVAELTKVSKDIVSRELDPIQIYLGAALLYLMLTSSLSFLAHRMQRRNKS